ALHAARGDASPRRDRRPAEGGACRDRGAQRAGGETRRPAPARAPCHRHVVPLANGRSGRRGGARGRGGGGDRTGGGRASCAARGSDRVQWSSTWASTAVRTGSSAATSSLLSPGSARRG